MNLQRIIKQIKNEAKASPVKVGVLSLLLLVALYNWAPMVYGWIADSSGSKSGGSSSSTSVSETSETSEPSEAMAVNREVSGREAGRAKKSLDSSKATWKQLAQWIDADPLMEPAGWPEGVECPFRVTDVDQASREIDEVGSEMSGGEETSPTIQLTPDTVEIIVSTVIIGPEGRLVRITGNIFREGEEVRIFDSGKIMPVDEVSAEEVDASESAVFTISKINPQFVEFSNGTENYRVDVSGREMPAWFSRSLKN